VDIVVTRYAWACSGAGCFADNYARAREARMNGSLFTRATPIR